MAKFKIPSFSFKGIPKITIPITDEEIRRSGDNGLKIISRYMPLILDKHYKNRKKLDYYYNYALGEQDVMAKKRLYNKDAKNNNIVIENHAYKHSKFKTAFITAQKRDYSHKSSSECEDMIYLDRYFTDTDFYAKDKNIKEWAYATGLGVSYTSHRTDVIVHNPQDNTYSYLTEKEGFDLKKNAPYEFEDLDPRNNFVVYSSIRGNAPLFCVSLVKNEVVKEGYVYSDSEFEYKLYVETRYCRFTANCSTSFTDFKDMKLEMQKSYHSIPMTEHYSNKERLGVVELNREMFNCINTLVSNVLDMTVDGANIIMVFKNTDIDQATIDKMNAKGAVILHDKQDNKNNSEAKLETITIKIDYAGLNSFYEERLTQMYDIASVPLASGQVTSGGDTGQARILGNGWENAYMMSNSDITTFTQCDYAVLKEILNICKNVPGCPLKNISASEIDIKYHINQSDNMLIKAQTIALLYGLNVPKEEILKVTNLFGDTCAVSQKWDKYDKEMKEEESKKANINPIPNEKGEDDGKENNVASKDVTDKDVGDIKKKDNNSKE